ncbi:hypothetical protein BPOR_0790g00060 [Botrytis porri]|uniref:Uncharacterized protein n=1 Tax=Botrytis porri TaxID=87229 RepID=A0A4Z1KN10_9HELO|nr:hypothetical protein BPOR_0790g00060 [Botrytis porri]
MASIIFSKLWQDLTNSIVSSTSTCRQNYTTDSLNQKARILTNVYSIKRNAMIGTLAVLPEKLRRCPESVMESNYDEWVIRQDLKRQIGEKRSGIQEIN